MDVQNENNDGPAKKEAADGGDPADVSDLVSMFEDSENTSITARARSERSRDYRDNNQLTAEEIATLRKRKQPDVVINRIAPKIDFLMGFEVQTRTDPKAFPRTPQDEDASEAATDGLRYLKDKNDLDQTFSAVWENIIVEGYGGLELIVEQKPDGTNEFDVKHWHWDRLFYDPHSRNPDFSDATFLGGVTWMDEPDALAMAGTKEAREAIQVTVSEASSSSETYDDRPTWRKWVTGSDRKRIRVVQIYYRRAGQWYWCHFTERGKIDGGKVSFVNQDGESWCPLMLASAYVNRKNERYGLVDIMIGPQDEINKRRSKSLHLMSMTQTIGEAGAVDDVDKMKREKAKPDGHIEVNPGFRFDMQENTTQLNGHIMLLQEAKAEIENIGPNAAKLGADDNAPSGKAILANKASGQTAVGFLFDRLSHLKRRTYEGLWDLVRQYKDEEWWVRVTDDEKNVKFVGFNSPVSGAERLKRDLEKQGADPQQIEAHIGQLMQDPNEAARLSEVTMENVPSQMHMDITIEEVPDTANIQAEQFEQLVQLSNGGVTFPPEVYIKASGLRNKDELVELVTNSQATAEQKKVEEAQVQAQFAEMKGKLAKLEAETEKIQAERVKILVEADIADAELGTVNLPDVIPPPSSNGQIQVSDIPPQEGGF